VRFAGRLARLFKKAALLPPRDPLESLSNQEMARAAEIIRLKTLGDGWYPKGRPAIAAEDASWFEAAIRPFLPAYAGFCAKFQVWQRCINPPRGAWARRAAACNFPAFAGRTRPELRLPPNLVAELVAATAATG
jgi:hypothetical protein